MKNSKHGGDLKNFARQFEIREKDILDFSSNISPLGLPESVKQLYPQLMESMLAYPDSSAQALRSEITRLYPLFPENVIAGNGSMALMALVMRTIAPKRALVIEPCFSEYRRLLLQQGAKVKSLVLKEAQQFQFAYREILGSLSGIDFMILGHPNNPTGTALKREELIDLLAECRRRNIFVVVDEAFADWNPQISIGREIKDNSFFFVLRSLTKFYGLAGIRAGYGLGARRLIETLEAQQEPWAMNGLAQALSVAAVRDGDFNRRNHEWFHEESARFASALQKIEGFRVFPSLANFLLVKVTFPQVSAESLYRFCGERKIYIRLLNDFPGLGAAFFRIAVRTPEDNAKLLEVFQEWSSRQKTEAGTAAQ